MEFKAVFEVALGGFEDVEGDVSGGLDFFVHGYALCVWVVMMFYKGCVVSNKIQSPLFGAVRVWLPPEICVLLCHRPRVGSNQCAV